MPNVKKMVNLLGTSKPFKLKDSDRDGVPNILDCKPYNPRKQGLIHKVAAGVARKVGAEKTAGRIEAKEREQEELKKIRREAQFTEAKKVAAERGRAVARRPSIPVRAAQTYIKGISYIQRGGRVPARTVRRRKKRKKKRTTTTVAKPGGYTPIKIF